MTTLKKFLFPVVAVVALVVSIISVWPKSNPILGGANGNQYVENYDSLIRYNGGYNSQLPIQTSSTLTTTGGQIVGSSGSTQSNVAFGTCKIYQYVNTISASTSITTDCVNTSSSGFGTSGGQVALSGNVQAGDKVFLTFASSSMPVNGLDLVGAIASSTNGYITMQLANQTGTTYTFSPSASTTLYFWAAR